MPRVLADQLLKELISVNEVRASPVRKLWENAMSDKIARRVIDTKWVLKRKVNQFGEVVRYKAILMAKGFRHIQRLDYHDVFAPTPSPAILR
ncbi:unnamed protein product, partial [Discosporangium mesarthrocarpum]